MQPSFLQLYLDAFHRIEGWFVYDAALMFMAYNQLIAAAGISGDTLEIGVYRGLSAITVAALRGAGRKMYAIDLFEELESSDAYGAGHGYRGDFEDNLRSFFGSLDFLVPVRAASSTLKSSSFPHTFSFCHVDGGHSPEETYADLAFASDVLVPGGLLALDDYFNPQHPGVCEGAIAFKQRHEGVLQPVAVGFHFNKVLFCKSPMAIDLNAEFSKSFPNVPHVGGGSEMWGHPAYLFGSPLRDYFDLYASTPNHLVPLGEAGVRAVFEPERMRLSAEPSRTISVQVVVKNTSAEPFPSGLDVFGLSYHLLSSDGRTIQHDNPRTWLRESIRAGEVATVNLTVAAPSTRGQYMLEIDLVWEGVMWFKDIRNPTCIIQLDVS